jgi:hypothetical protein
MDGGVQAIEGTKIGRKREKKKKKKKKYFNHKKTPWLPRPMLAGYFVYRLSA